MYTVYWICLKNQFDVKKEGYVGITKFFNKRMTEHKNLQSNKILNNVIKKYGWHNLNKKILIDNIDLELALLIEKELRPKERIGWNIQSGGMIPLAPFGKKNALGNKSRIGKIKYKIKCVEITTNKFFILEGKTQLIKHGFNSSCVYKCLYNGKSHKGFTFTKITLP